MSVRAGLFLGCWIGLGLGCSEDGPEPQDDLEAEVRRLIDDAVASGFSGAVLVASEGRHLVAEGHGLANRETDAANTVDTAFDVGSIMKDLTAVAIYKLDETGLLSVSDTLGSLLPEVPNDKADITLRQIVQHRAGFDEYHDTEGDFEALTRQEARERILSQELLFEPGSEEAYSNSGYTLLADVVQEVSGESFTDYIQHALLEPAGMEQTGFYSDDALWQRVETAVGYEAATFGDNDPATWPYTWALIGNGGLVSTVVDLERWSTALWEGQILRPDTLEALRSDHLSVGAVSLAGETVYAGAGAGDFGLGGVSIVAPGKDLQVILTTNTFDTFDIESLAVDLVTLLLTDGAE
jgi:CubicO group peptidase (beta-lactamase class C family)